MSRSYFDPAVTDIFMNFNAHIIHIENQWEMQYYHASLNTKCAGNMYYN
jgi:hypothetical protein